MKSVLISIRPQWCEKIASGKKTIEVRKSAPKEVPFKAYIYETKHATEMPWVDNDEPNDFCDGEITRPPQSYMFVKELKSIKS